MTVQLDAAAKSSQPPSYWDNPAEQDAVNGNGPIQDRKSVV